MFMGNSASAAQARRASERSAEIDRVIEEDSKKLKGEVKILILGSDEPGKSSFIKRMGCFHRSNLSLEDRIAYRPVIYRDLLESVQALALALECLFVEPLDAQNREIAKQIARYELEPSSFDDNYRFPEQLVAFIHQLWHDPVSSLVVGYHNDEFCLINNAAYFCAHVKRIGSASYIPEEEDILKCRYRPAVTGVTETRFKISETAQGPRPRLICMVDPGGQQSRSRRWIRCFDSVTSVLFCTSLIEYDQEPLDPQYQSRMEESLELFGSVVESRWFSNPRPSIILLMNGIEALRGKILRSPLERHFPGYTGGTDVHAAAGYIRSKYMRARHTSLTTYVFFPPVTGLSDVRWVMAAVEETLLNNTLGAVRIL